MIAPAAGPNGLSLRAFYEVVYQPLKGLGWKSTTKAQYENAVRHWSRFAGNTPVAEVDDLLVAEFTAWMLDGRDGREDGRAAATVNKNLRHLGPVLRFAHKKKVLCEVPEITMLPENLDPPRAFLLEEFKKIVTAAKLRMGTVCGLPANDWWESLLLSLYDSGGRIGAVLDTLASNLDLETGWILLPGSNQKQRHGQMLRLHTDTLAVCRRLLSVDPQRKYVWPWPSQPRTLYRNFRTIIEAAEVETWTGTGSLFHRIRKTTASYTAAAGGDPVAQMGHSSPSVTDRYLDPRISVQQMAVDVLPRP